MPVPLRGEAYSGAERGGRRKESEGREEGKSEVTVGEWRGGMGVRCLADIAGWLISEASLVGSLS